MHDDVVSEQSRMGSPDHLSVGHETACHGSHFADAKNLYHLRSSQNVLLVSGFEQSFQGVLNVVDSIIYDGIRPDIDMLLLGQGLGFRPRPHIETTDDRVGSRR